MASNGKPHFITHVFSQQPNVAAAEAGRRFGKQDKARISSARPATPQPAAVPRTRRATRLHPNGTRSTNRNTHHKTRVHLDLWVNPIVKVELQRIAKQEGISMSKAGAAFLERALQQNVDMQYHALIDPVIKTAVQNYMGGGFNRLAWLLVRIAFAAEQDRALTANILGRMPDMTKEQLNHILAMSQNTAKRNITHTSPEMRELVDAVESFLLADTAKEEGSTI
jgi:hypothetical protein